MSPDTPTAESSEVPARPQIDWLEWGPEPFARARAEGKPVLLSITASWCHGCGVMDTVTYGDAGVAAAIRAGVIPVRVDADRRPDVNDRYNLDGWPTTVFLTASGEMLTGTTYLPADGFRSLLAEVTDAYSARRDALDERAAATATARRARRPSPASALEPDLAAPAWLTQRLRDEFDREHGGFGAAGKFLHVPALLAAVQQCEREPSDELRAVITGTLDAMAAGGVFDAVEGGFYRYAGERAWTRPHTEKMLDDQAGLVRVYLEAARVFDRASWRDVARDIIGYVHSRLADVESGTFFGSQAADDAYYQLHSLALRRTLTPPRVDRTLYTDWTAQACASWLRAGELLGNSALSEMAGRALDRAVVATYRPGEGVAHWVSGEQSGARGLLTDQVSAASALLDLHEATGNPTWSMLAEELMRTALRTLWDPQGGGFLDRPATADAIGLLADPLKPLSANCTAAVVLARLSRLTGDAGLHQHALDTLRAQTATYRDQGLFGAPYALAVMDIFR